MKILKISLFILAIISVVIVGRGILTSSISYESKILVNKSVEESWAVMSDESKLHEWIKGFKKTELVSGKANNIGAVSNVYIEENGEEMIMKETITAFDVHQKIGMNFHLNIMDMDYEMLFSEKDGQTQIITKSKNKGNNLFGKVITAWMQGGMKTQEDKNLNKLKKVIETNTKSYSF
jgi:Polyketide cyclase / dehydrase and lipid transport.